MLRANLLKRILSQSVTIPTFRSTWNTANTSAGSSTATQVKLPLISGKTYNMVVNWGDGNSDTITTWNAAATTHTYSTSGTYTITITGTCGGFKFNNLLDKLKILSISEWGVLNISDNAVFYGCTNLTCSATDAPTISTTSFANMFNACSNFNGSIGNWNTTGVTSMSLTFYGCSVFNQNIGSWVVSSVTDFGSMFYNATAFNNGGSDDINSWTLKNSGTISLISMFSGSSTVVSCKFNRNITSWTTTYVNTMAYMFRFNTAFNQNIGSWNTANVTSFKNTFQGCTSFNQNLGAWNVSVVTIFSAMFYDATIFNNGGSSDIDNWTLKSTGTIGMDSMFYRALAFNQPIGSWNVTRVTDMGFMFAGSSAMTFNQNINGWQPSTCTTISGMFQNNQTFTQNQTLAGWGAYTGTIANMSSFNSFGGGSAKTIDMSSWIITGLASGVGTGADTIYISTGTITTALYDALLIAWSAQTVGTGRRLSVGSAKYTAGGAAATARALMVTNGWVITDAGPL